MISVNGVVIVGTKQFIRLDNVTENGPVGLEMIQNPFALVGKREDAERIAKALNEMPEYKD